MNLPPDVRRIVCLGDSITWAGYWVDYVDAFLVTRLPERRIEVLNLGLPSETVSGLSEAGHAGGAFPRPNLHERLGRVLERTRPDLVLACYGMNDGIYQPFDDARFAAYRNGVEALEKALAGARRLWLTPPVFDRTRLEQPPDFDYDGVLARYGAWLRGRRKGPVADVHTPMARHLSARRRRDPGYFLAADGIHANPFGHWFFAQAVLEAWKAPRQVASIHMAPGSAPPPVPLPLAIDPEWDPQAVRDEKIRARWSRLSLTVDGAPDGRFALDEDGRRLGVFTGSALRRGIDLAALDALSLHVRAGAVLEGVRRRQQLLRDAWLTETGHRRPGLPTGLPIETARERASAIDAELRRLAAPAPLALSLRPL